MQNNFSVSFKLLRAVKQDRKRIEEMQEVSMHMKFVFLAFISEYCLEALFHLLSCLPGRRVTILSSHPKANFLFPRIL